MNTNSRAILFFIFIIAFSTTIMSQHKPEPLKSALLNNISGTWASDEFEMMGAKWSDEANHYMIHNGQFMQVDLKGKNSLGETYTGTIILRPENDGSLKGWSFDDWGMVTTYTGNILGDNKVTVTGTSVWGTETRVIEINGNKMTHDVTFMGKGPDGKDMTTTMKINYNKK